MGARSAALLACLAGCDDVVLGVPVEGDVAPEGPAYSCDWDGVQAFFAARCDACHGAGEDGEPGSGGFVLVDAIEADLADGTGFYVIPGNPGGSVLWQSLTGTGTALLMPYGLTEPLEMAQIEHVSCWITDGASL